MAFSGIFLAVRERSFIVSVPFGGGEGGTSSLLRGKESVISSKRVALNTEKLTCDPLPSLAYK